MHSQTIRSTSIQADLGLFLSHSAYVMLGQALCMRRTAAFMNYACGNRPWKCEHALFSQCHFECVLLGEVGSLKNVYTYTYKRIPSFNFVCQEKTDGFVGMFLAAHTCSFH